MRSLVEGVSPKAESNMLGSAEMRKFNDDFNRGSINVLKSIDDIESAGGVLGDLSRIKSQLTELQWKATVINKGGEIAGEPELPLTNGRLSIAQLQDPKGATAELYRLSSEVNSISMFSSKATNPGKKFKNDVMRIKVLVDWRIRQARADFDRIKPLKSKLDEDQQDTINELSGSLLKTEDIARRYGTFGNPAEFQAVRHRLDMPIVRDPKVATSGVGKTVHNNAPVRLPPKEALKASEKELTSMRSLVEDAFADADSGFNPPNAQLVFGYDFNLASISLLKSMDDIQSAGGALGSLSSIKSQLTDLQWKATVIMKGRADPDMPELSLRNGRLSNEQLLDPKGIQAEKSRLITEMDDIDRVAFKITNPGSELDPDVMYTKVLIDWRVRQIRADFDRLYQLKGQLSKLDQRQIENLSNSLSKDQDNYRRYMKSEDADKFQALKDRLNLPIASFPKVRHEGRARNV